MTIGFSAGDKTIVRNKTIIGLKSLSLILQTGFSIG